MATMAAVVVLPENHDDRAIQAVLAEFRGQLLEKIRPMEILPCLQTYLYLHLLRNPEILDLVVVERLQTVIVTVPQVLLVFP
jgi:hypothetical protein